MTKLAVLSLPVLLALPVGLVPEFASPSRPDSGLAAAPTLADERAESIVAGKSGRAPLPVALPHAERLVLDGTEELTGDALVAAFEITLAPPEVLRIVTSVGEGARGALAVDVLQRRGELGVARLATFGGRVGAIESRWTPPVSGTYLVHVRAPADGLGAFGFALQRRAPLAFPVATDADDSVRSIFGDARDGGRRVHHGIDIFAPRGTPVVAAADGLVTRVSTSTRGGLHVWQRAVDDGQRVGSLYYAHLDSTAVTPGQRVARGDVLGTVGNTGNARTTPPHLHFGLYRRFRGPEDPLPLVGRARVPIIAAGHGHALAPWLRVASPALNLRAGPGTSFDVVARLGEDALVRVLGVVGGASGAASTGPRTSGLPSDGRWVRVRASSADGGTLDGFVARSLLAPTEPLPFVLDAPAALLAAPRADAPRLVALGAGTALEATGTFDGYRRVVTGGGLDGWLVELPVDGERDVTLPDG